MKDLVRAQHDLQVDSFKLDPLELEGEERVEFIRWNVLALTDELHEMLAETGWKPWATSAHVNEYEAFGELVDALHFFMNLLMAVSPREFTPEQVADRLVNRYYMKRQVNAVRQEEGYDGVSTKCPQCHRELSETDPMGHWMLTGPPPRRCCSEACARHLYIKENNG